MSRFTQFSSNYDVDFPSIPKGWKDISYGNDTCPSFEVVGKRLVVWVDAADPDKREVPGKRFGITRVNADCEYIESLLDTDDWNEVLAFVSEQLFVASDVR